MDESELTRKAIEEIMREMNAQKEADQMPQIRERKLNPLGRPNKDFLDRTINSIMTHNKRELDRNYRKCQSKLRAMDRSKTKYDEGRRQGRERQRSRVKVKRKRRYTESTSTSSSDSSSVCSKDRGSKHKKGKKKKKRNRKQTSSKSSSSESDSSSLSLDAEKPTPPQFTKNVKDEDPELHRDLYDDPASLGYYVDPNMAMAAMAYSHMNHLMLQQQQNLQDLVKAELENDDGNEDDNDDAIPSDLSLNYHSAESEINISLNTSSAEEDENGILTFKVTSDEESPQEKITRKMKIHPKTRKKRNRNIKTKDLEKITLLETSSESDSLSKIGNTNKEEITVLSSSSRSDSEEDLKRTTDEITTILSSCSSTETEEDANATSKQEHITILSSSSSLSSSDNEIQDEKQQRKESQNEIQQDTISKNLATNENKKTTTTHTNCDIDLTSSDNEETGKQLIKSLEGGEGQNFLSEAKVFNAESKYKGISEPTDSTDNLTKESTEYKNDEVDELSFNESISREPKIAEFITNSELIKEDVFEPTESPNKFAKISSKENEDATPKISLDECISKEPQITEIGIELTTKQVSEEEECIKNSMEQSLSDNNQNIVEEKVEEDKTIIEASETPENNTDLNNKKMEEKCSMLDNDEDKKTEIQKINYEYSEEGQQRVDKN